MFLSTQSRLRIRIPLPKLYSGTHSSSSSVTTPQQPSPPNAARKTSEPRRNVSDSPAAFTIRNDRTCSDRKPWSLPVPWRSVATRPARLWALVEPSTGRASPSSLSRCIRSRSRIPACTRTTLLPSSTARILSYLSRDSIVSAESGEALNVWPPPTTRTFFDDLTISQIAASLSGVSNLRGWAENVSFQLVHLLVERW